MATTSRVQPPMDHERDAKALTERLLKNIGEGERDYVSQPLDIYVADVEAGVERFDSQLRYCLRFQVGFPCVSISELVAVDWSNLTPFLHIGLWPWFTRPEQFHWFEQEWQSVPPFGSFGGVKLVSPLDAVSLFREGLIRFLTVRFSARQSNISTNPGLQFRVTTHTYGLRVHWSPAYFFNANNVFGSPTSPVDAWIQPGKYMFGAVGPSFPSHFDSGTFDIPPRTQANLVSI